MHRLWIFAALIASVYAQTRTITDAAGDVVVIDATLDEDGLPVTETLETLDPAVETTPIGEETTALTNTRTTTTPVTTPTQGPVDQPGATNTALETPYTYTTVVDGVTTAIEATFTPTTPPTLSTVDPGAGTATIWDYDEWNSIYGNNAGNPQDQVDAGTRTETMRLGFVMALLGGGWLGLA